MSYETKINSQGVPEQVVRLNETDKDKLENLKRPKSTLLELPIVVKMRKQSAKR